MGWRTIDSAPKDNGPLFLIVKGFEPVVGEWSDSAGWWFSESDDPPENWGKEDYRPTHWWDFEDGKTMPDPPA